MSDRDDTRDNHENTRECGSMFDPRAAGYPELTHTHPRGANGPRIFGTSYDRSILGLGYSRFMTQEVHV
jgi:hypothetical protein